MKSATICSATEASLPSAPPLPQYRKSRPVSISSRMRGNALSGTTLGWENCSRHRSARTGQLAARDRQGRATHITRELELAQLRRTLQRRRYHVVQAHLQRDADLVGRSPRRSHREHAGSSEAASGAASRPERLHLTYMPQHRGPGGRHPVPHQPVIEFDLAQPDVLGEAWAWRGRAAPAATNDGRGPRYLGWQSPPVLRANNPRVTAPGA